MFVKEITNFHDSMRPLVYFNCLVGMGPHRQPDVSNALYLSMQIYTVVITILNWITTYIALCVMRNIEEFSDVSINAHAMYYTLSATNSCIALSTPFLLWLRRKGLKECLRQMQSLDSTFEAIVGARNEYRKQYIRLLYKVIAIILVMILVGIIDVQWIVACERSLLRNISISIALHFPILVVLVVDLNFCTFVGYLGKKFLDLNDALLRLADKPLASSPSDRLFIVSRNVVRMRTADKINNDENEGLVSDKHHSVHEIRKVHLELCKVYRTINSLFGIQNLLSMGISFVMVTGLLYTIYSAFSFRNFTIERLKQIIPSMAWAMIYAFKVWSVNHACSIVSSESERTGQVIYELLKPKVDGELQREIQEFATQMLQNPVRFNACGFFTLDCTFIQGVIGSITTYLVILIQMSHVPDVSNTSTTTD